MKSYLIIGVYESKEGKLFRYIWNDRPSDNMDYILYSREQLGIPQIKKWQQEISTIKYNQL